MRKTALTLSAFCLLIYSLGANAQTVYDVNRTVDNGTVKGSIEVAAGRFGPLSQADILSWSFELFDGTDTLYISSTEPWSGLQGTGWSFLSATPTQLLFDFDGARAAGVNGVTFHGQDEPSTQTYSVDYNLTGLGLEQIIHQFGSSGGHFAAQERFGTAVEIGTTEPISVTQAELPRRFEALDLSSIVNSDLGGKAFGTIFPTPGPTMFGDIPFNMTDGGNGNTWIVEGLQVAADGFSNPPAAFSISGLNIDGAIAMYAQINSAFGICGNEVGSIGVSGDSDVDFSLIEGENIRDWLGYSFCSQQTDAIYTSSFDFPGGDGIPADDARLDVYGFDLSGLSGAINEFRFQNFGNFFILGAPFLSAVTFEIRGYNYELLDYPGTATTQVFGNNEKGEVVGIGHGDPADYSFVYSTRRDLFQDVTGAAEFVETVVLDISNKGHIVGAVTESIGGPWPAPPSPRSGFIRDRDGNFTIFDHPDGDNGDVCQTVPRGVNANGLVSGYYRLCDWSLPGGFIYDTKTQSFTDIVPSNSTIVHGINADGYVVGRAIFSDEEDPCNSAGSNHYGWLRAEDGSVTYFQVNGLRTDARGINDDGYIVGFFRDPSSGYRKGFRVKLAGDSTCEPVTLDEDEILHFPGYNDTFPQGISNSGIVVGSVRDGSGYHGFIARPK